MADPNKKLQKRTKPNQQKTSGSQKKAIQEDQSGKSGVENKLIRGGLGPRSPGGPEDQGDR